MKINKDYIAIVMILVIFILFLNTTLKTPIVFGDEGYYSYQAKWIADNSILPKYETYKETDVFHPTMSRPPLFIITESFFFMFGEIAVKFMIPIFSILTAFMLYIFLKKTVNANAGLAAALIYLATPSLVTYAVMTYVDTMFSLLVLCSLYFGYLALEHGQKKDTILSGIFFGLATLTKITAPIIFLALGLYFVYSKYYKDVNKWKILILIGVVALLIVSPWLIRNVVLFKDVCYGLSGCPAIEDTLIEHSEAISNLYAGRTSGGGTESSLIKLGTLAYTNFAYGWIMIFLALFGIVYAIKERKKPEMLMIMLMVAVIPIFMFYSTRVEDTARYTLPVIIAMAALGGIFLSKVYDNLRAKHLMIAIIIILLIVPSIWYFGQDKLNTMQNVKSFSSGFFDACNWVEKNTPNDSLLLSIYSQQTAYSCNRRVSTAIPDFAEITMTNNETSYQHLKLHGYDYIFVQVGLISQTPYQENIPLAFYQYMGGSPHFVKAYDNTQTFGNDGVIIYEVKY